MTGETSVQSSPNRSRSVALRKLREPTRAALLSVICVGASIICVIPTRAQQPAEKPAQTETQQIAVSGTMLSPADCRRCHTCPNPTPQNRCLLHPCTRRAASPGEDARKEDLGPDVIILDELEDAYLPVPFDHRGHARMAEMANGCVTCHHYTPEGQSHPACKSCHDIAADGTDIFKPGLKGAYHQQCLNCHREWIDERDCDICHRAKAGRSPAADQAASPTKDDILGLMHPPIPQPATDIYRAGAGGTTEGKVVFRHGEHVNRFGLNCVNCHHEPSCSRCHTRSPGSPSASTPAEHHRPCIRCHKRDMDLAARAVGRCDNCHWANGQPEPERFNHANTGWPLNKYHQPIGCRGCHTALPFAKLNTECVSCHSGWTPSTFDHRVTGQVLDENHVDEDCDACHIDRKFDRPPTCTECHDDEDEGIAFPAQRPGPRFSGSAAKAPVPST